ncbi:MAG: NAD(P)/FAD-dependent oxidoreductase [Pyrinomonadaceae bacterium]|nr:NAD(P)/FAD-dependent oxidoreductase [Pyrinomonadaceae bacterium]
MSEQEAGRADAAVVGGGLAGLVAAAELARGGLKVVLLEKSNHAGGRAITQKFEDGYRFNLGPHALYRKGAAQKILRGLGVKWTGGLPPTKGGHLIYQGRKFISPLGTWSLLRTGLLSLREKLETARLLSSLKTIDVDALDNVTLRAWLESVSRSERVRQLMATIVRVTTYMNDSERLSAGAALRQVRLGLAGNVDYLDNGWQTLVDGALDVARSSGVRVLTNASVIKIKRDGDVYALRLRSGEIYRASAVVLATSPQAAVSLIEGGEESALRKWADEALPVKAACLDIALKRLPQPRTGLFALGVDRPLYCIAHSVSAKLAPEGGAVIHLMKNHSTGEDADARADRAELEGLLDLVQPGWRASVAHARFLPAITVSNSVVTAERGGTRGRPGPMVPGLDNLYVAGDWVGAEGMLLDASLASAHHAAQLILERRSEAARTDAASQRERLIA